MTKTAQNPSPQGYEFRAYGSNEPLVDTHPVATIAGSESSVTDHLET
jgi:hypothetical protein